MYRYVESTGTCRSTNSYRSSQVHLVRSVSCNTCYPRQLHSIRDLELGYFFPPWVHCLQGEQTGNNRAGSRLMGWGRCRRGSWQLMGAKPPLRPTQPQLLATLHWNHHRPLQSTLSWAQHCCCSPPIQSISCYHPTECRENNSCTHFPSQNVQGGVRYEQLPLGGFRHQQHHNILF